MDLLEYQGKQLFAKHGVPVPEGQPAKTVDEAVAAADELGYPCVVKAQVLIGGRGKAGGIKLAQNRERGRGARRGDPRHGHQGLHRARGVRREGQRDRRGVLRRVRVRPLRQDADGDVLEDGRDGRRGGRRDRPRGHAHAARGPADRLPGLPRPPAGLRGGHRRRRDPPGRRAALQALRRVRGRGRDARRGQPAPDHQATARWWRSTPRSPSTTTRSSATPTSPSSARAPRTPRSRWPRSAGSPT